MDGLSAAASVIAVIQITEDVVKLCSQYLRAVKNAKSDIGRLEGELSSLKIFLEDALELLRGPNGARLETSQRLRNALEYCFSQLKGLEIKLRKKLETGKLMSRFGMRALAWPFERKDVDNIVKELGNFRDTLSACLNIDQLRLSAQTFERLDEQEQLTILKWISPILYRKHHDTVKESRTSGTCEWLLASEKFREWESSSSSMVLWLQGSPGAGKTFLTSKVIDYVQTSLYNSPKQEGFAFFYCNRNEEERRKPLSVLQSFVRQLSTAAGYSREMRKNLRDLWREAQLKGTELGMKACQEQLLESVNLYAKTTFVLDALDECEPDSRGCLVETIEFLLSKSSKPIKVFISSRPDRDIRERFLSKPNIEIQATHNQEDIKKFVVEEIIRHGSWREMSPSLQEQIIRVLLERSQGMFQWVSLQIKQILDLETEEAIQDRLGKLPPNLKAAYDEIYDRIKSRHKYDKALADSAFKWVMCAIEPLSSKELMAAIRLDPEKDTINLNTEITESRLLHLCNNLLVIDSQQKVWRFSHLSVTEYFEDNFWDLRQAQCYAAKVCLKLLLETCEEPKSDRVSSSEEENETCSIFNTKHPLQVYARQHWISHIQTQEGKDADPLLAGLLKNFLGSPTESSTQYQAWFRDIFKNRDYLSRSIFNTVTIQDVAPYTTPIFIMCRFSLYSILSDWWDGPETLLLQTNIQGDSLLTLAAQAGCKPICDLLIRRRLQVDLQSGVHGSALAAAAYCGENDIVQFLVQQGADANMMLQIGKHGSALAAATYCGEINIIQFLVQQGADINMMLQSGEHGSALAAAAYYGKNNIVQFLVQQGADINMMLQTGKHGSALAAAAYYGEVKIVQFLVQQGADMNMVLQCGNSGSALAAAAAVFPGNTETIQFLVQQGADVNTMLQCGRYGSALAAAVTSEDTKTIQLLVHKGADVNMMLQSGQYGSALAAAAYWGNTRTVEFLVQQGAEVNMILQSGQYGSALAAAAASMSGSPKTIEFLVQEGADLNLILQSGKYGSALAAATTQNSTKAIEFLVQQGADVNMMLQSGQYGSALVAAIIGGTPETVQFLVQKGADMNMVLQSGQYGSALVAAVCQGNTKTIEFLVQQGADMNMILQSGEYGSALAAAAYYGENDIIQLLIQQGADVNMEFQGRRFGSALAAAAYWGEKECVESLINAGAKANLTALQASQEDLSQEDHDQLRMDLTRTRHRKAEIAKLLSDLVRGD